MADNQNRGRRRPSQEYSAQTLPKEEEATTSAIAALRRRAREDTTKEEQEEEPSVKHIKIEEEEEGALEQVERTEELPTTSKAAATIASLGITKMERETEVTQLNPFKQTLHTTPTTTPLTAEERQQHLLDRYQIIYTRPIDVQTKKGKQGTILRLQTNYFRLSTKPTWRLYQYIVKFQPEVDSLRFRCGLLGTQRDKIGGYLYDGFKLFTTVKQEAAITNFNVTSKRDDNYTISIKYVGDIAMNEWQSVQVLNLILRHSMKGLNLQLVGRNLFDAIAKIDVPEYRLQLWPGYITSIRQHEKDILLCAELVHKVMRTETVLDMLLRIRDNTRDYQDEFRKQILGTIVLTDYNNKTYRVNDVDFVQCPLQTFNIKGKEITFVEYYKQRYNIRIQHTKQPLLISKVRDTAESARSNDIVVLIPELCRATGFTENMRNNFHAMRTMSQYTRMDPRDRIERLRKFNNRLQNTEKSVKVLNDWNMRLEKDLVEIEGRQLDMQRIVFHDQKRLPAGENADWTRHFKDAGMFTTPSRGLDRWSAIGTNRHARELRNFVEALMRAAASMKLKISRPREVLIYDDRNHSYVQAMDECCRMDPQLILLLVPNTNVERYSTIKKKGCLERAIPTQVVTFKSANNLRSLMSIATKVAIQMNCKLGYTPWMIEIPLSGLMTIGFDMAKCTRDRSKAFVALVASMDLKCNATFYSTVAECSAKDVLCNNIWPMMHKALCQYRREHDNKLPARIIFYRSGLGEGSLKDVYKYEINEIVERLTQEYKRANIDRAPMFAYIMVTKMINTRLFANGRNPPAGTVVDDVITLPERYDFYLVSQCVRQGTVSPTSYNILYSNIKLSPDQIQLLTYKMTHLYFNWSGTIRVPAVCQYAKKLAVLVATNLCQPPQSALEKKLFYL